MVSIIAGENAGGKSVYLRKLAENQTESFACNFELDKEVEMIKMNQEDVKWSKEYLRLSSVVEDEYNMRAAYEEFSSKEKRICNEKLLQSVSILCKDCNHVYLDEPEFSLSSKEVRFLRSMLPWFKKDIWIVTHSSDLVSGDFFKYYTVKDNNLIEVKEDDIDEYIY